MKQNVQTISQITDEIDSIFETHPEKEAKYCPSMKILNDDWDRLQINLLENSVLDSTDLDVSGEVKNVCLDDGSTPSNDPRLGKSKMETDANALLAKADEPKSKDNITNVGLRDNVIGDDAAGVVVDEVIGNDVVVDEVTGSDVAVDGVIRDEEDIGVSSEANKKLTDKPNEKICDKSISENDLFAEEKVSEIIIEKCEAGYDFGVLEEDERMKRIEVVVKELPTDGNEAPESKTEMTIGKDRSNSEIIESDVQYLSECIDDTQYIEEFSNRIDALETIIEKEKEKDIARTRPARKFLGSLKLICTSRIDKIKEPEDLSSSVCSMISESSGIYSFDHDDNTQYASEPASYNMKTISYKPSNQSIDSQSDVEAGEAIVTESPGGVRSSRPVEIFTRQQAVSEDSSPQAIVNASKEDNNKGFEQEAKENTREAYKKDTRDSDHVDIKWGEKLIEKENGADSTEMNKENLKYEDRLKNRSLNGEKGIMSDDRKALLSHEMKRDEFEDGILAPYSLETIVCDQAEDLVLPEEHHVDVNERKSVDSANQQSSLQLTKEVEMRIGFQRQEDDKSIECDSSEFDFGELLRKLESASKSSDDTQEHFVSPQSNERLSATNGPSINVIPPTPRRSSISSCTSESAAPNLTFDLPDINVTPATPRRMSFNSQTSSPPQSPHNAPPVEDNNTSFPVIIDERKSKIPYKRFSSVNVPMPDIQVIPPTPRRQSLDLSTVSNAFPVIEIIPPTPRRQSLGSESECPIIIPHINGGQGDENLNKEPLSPSLFSSLPSPIIPRVWNWLEKSVFDNALPSGQDTVDDSAVIGRDAWEQNTVNHGGVNDREKDVSNTIEEVDGKEELESEIQELKIVNVASEWPLMDEFEEDEKDKVEGKENNQDNDNYSYCDNFTATEEHSVFDVLHDKSTRNLKEMAHEINEELLQKNAGMEESKTEDDDEGVMKLRDAAMEVNTDFKDTEIKKKAERLPCNEFQSVEISLEDEIEFKDPNKICNEDLMLNDIEDHLKDIGAQQLALKQRRDSGTVEETRSRFTCLDDLIDSETHDAMAAGMDAFYARVGSCLESMNNINRLVMDNNEQGEGKQDDMANHMRVRNFFGVFNFAVFHCIKY